MLMKNEKKKKHPLMAIAVGGLAMFGAYSIVSGAKNACKSKVCGMMNAMKKNKGAKQSYDAEDCSCTVSDCDSSGVC